MFAVVRQIGEVLVAVERVDVLPTLRSEGVHVGPDGAVQVELTADAAERLCRSGMVPYGVMFTSPEEVAGKPRTRRSGHGQGESARCCTSRSSSPVSGHAATAAPPHSEVGRGACVMIPSPTMRSGS